MMQAQELLDCERCFVYLVDTEADENQVSLVFVELEFRRRQLLVVLFCC